LEKKWPILSFGLTPWMNFGLQQYGDFNSASMKVLHDFLAKNRGKIGKLCKLLFIEVMEIFNFF